MYPFTARKLGDCNTGYQVVQQYALAMVEFGLTTDIISRNFIWNLGYNILVSCDIFSNSYFYLLHMAGAVWHRIFK